MKAKRTISAEQSVGTSIIVSVGDIIFNIVAAIATNSTVMLSQALQGGADLTTALLLLVGVKRSKRAADHSHPLGFGREVFFWTLLAGIFTLVITGGFAVSQGIKQVISQEQLSFPLVALGMLGFGLITNTYSMRISLKRLGAGFGDTDFKTVLHRIVNSSLIETKTTLLVDLMGMLSALAGLIAISLFIITGDPIFDGLGAILVGFTTMAGAVLLIYNLRDLIVGVSPRQDVIEQIKAEVLAVQFVQDVLDLRVITIGSGKLLVIVEVHFADKLETDDIERITDMIKLKLKQTIPEINRVQVEAETPDL